ncbi:hypothetical protein GFS60_00688 [Rhodococcus sp. WAY2]|nr:hypothetical protein GFS60_00688 [Rhodococcus sp. WAY2]
MKVGLLVTSSAVTVTTVSGTHGHNEDSDVQELPGGVDK